MKRKFTSAFKAQVAIEALKERETLSELSARFGVHATMISKWKQEFLARSAQVFEKGDEESAPQVDSDVSVRPSTPFKFSKSHYGT